MSKDIAAEIVNVIEESNLSKFQCTFHDTEKTYKWQYYYHCNDCWEKNSSGCCIVCAMTCHKDHDLSELRYGRFFCDCSAESSDGRKCKMYKKITYPGDKLEKIQLTTYCTFILDTKDVDSDQQMKNIENILSDNWVNHYTFTSKCNNGNNGNNTIQVYVAWSGQSSLQVMKELRTISASWAKSTGCEPAGNVMVWSKEDKKYLNCGPVHKYREQYYRQQQYLE